MWKLALLITLWIVSCLKTCAHIRIEEYPIADSLAAIKAAEKQKIRVETDTSPVRPAVRPLYKFRIAPYILPAGLIGYGTLRQFSPVLKRFDNHSRDEVQSRVKKGTHIDDYLQYAPAAAVFGLDVLGIAAKHDLKSRSLVLATSSIMAIAIVRGTKASFRIARPDGSNYKSFPSGHTATAFIGAHMLYKEYGEQRPWLAVAGYSIATTTAALRVVNNKHWVSDVLAGAGVGMLSVELAYRLLPTVDRWVSKSTRETFHLQPVQYQQGGSGLALSYRF